MSLPQPLNAPVAVGPGRSLPRRRLDGNRFCRLRGRADRLWKRSRRPHQLGLLHRFSKRTLTVPARVMNRHCALHQKAFVKGRLSARPVDDSVDNFWNKSSNARPASKFTAVVAERAGRSGRDFFGRVALLLLIGRRSALSARVRANATAQGTSARTTRPCSS